MPFPIFAMMLCVFGVGTAEYVVTGVLPGISDDLSVSIPTAGLLVTIYAVTVMIGGPLLTVVTVRLPRKALMVSLMVVFVIGNVGAALAPSFGILIVARVLAALTHATLFALCLIVATSLVAAERAGRAIANVALGLNLATVLGVPIGTLIGHAASWRATFGFVAAFSVVATVVLLVALRTVRTLPAGASTVRRELRVFGKSSVLTAIVMTALGQSGVFIVFTYITPLLTGPARFGTASVTILLLVFGVGSIVGNYIGGRAADRAALPALVGLLGALAVALVLVWLVLPSKALTVMMLFVFGATSFAIIPGLASRILGAAADAPNLAATVNIAGFQVANALGSWVGGVIISGSLGLTALPLAGAVAVAAGFLLAVAIWVRKRRSATTDPAPTEALSSP